MGYDLFPGNTFEGRTLDVALEKLEKRFGIRQVIIVADKGLNSKINLKKITDKGYNYIFASRLKSMKKEIQPEIFGKDGYQERGEISYKIISYTNKVKDDNQIYKLPENLVITYSPKRAKKDRADREKLIKKARSLLENKARIKASNKRGGKKYLKETRSTDWAPDEQAILNDQRFDGYYGVQVSEKQLKPEDILAAHNNLWKIEESFRIMKTTLEVRPVSHWTEPRIKGHFVICFLAFLLEKTLESKLKKANLSASPQEIREALNSMNFAEVKIKESSFFIKTKFESLGNKILRLFRIKPPKNVTPVREFPW